MFRRLDTKRVSPAETMTARKLYLRLLNHTQNVRFADFCKVVEAFGYRRDRISGSGFARSAGEQAKRDHQEVVDVRHEEHEPPPRGKAGIDRATRWTTLSRTKANALAQVLTRSR